MMPTAFPESNLSLTAPPGQPDVQTLPCWRGEADGYPCVVSAWKPSWRERLSILFGGRVWLQFRATTHPPVAVSGARRYFRSQATS